MTLDVDDAQVPQTPCGTVDPDLFFPTAYGGTHTRQVAAAKALCHHCVQRSACLQYAIDTEQDHGIWGGATPLERQRVSRLQRW